MPVVRPPTTDFVRVVDDSRRWRSVKLRSDDVIICTPPKSGTTWMQGIVESLLWPDGDAPVDPTRNVWVDSRARSEEEMLQQLDRQAHRRYIKTHSPANSIPIDEACRYITVFRDGRDTLVSWANHRTSLRRDVIEAFNEQTADDDNVVALDPDWDGDMDELFEQWERDCNPVTHLASWWPLRRETFVLFVHYNDLSADLDGEMRRIADYLEIDVPDRCWPDVVERCRLDRMRDAAAAHGRLDRAFEGGADSFFFKGTNGRWRDVLVSEQLDRFDRLVSDGLPHDASTWMEHGSLRLGRRPETIG